ncbi:MAG: hypothetical protein SOY64_01815 [Pyramidobacter sp.]|uniref:YfcC family protein n=1 Tax=Pyramidobacter sp. TaxID=1943581 RepID=UPI002A8369EF|nr:hypothetical protein [Pyramidobacter sp.]MDY4031790.1 hypothetical protein [Pyramidobacter sp.]
MSEARAKKPFRMPHMFVLITAIVIIAMILTWIIPAGTYERVTNAAGIKVVLADKFKYIPNTPVYPWEIPSYIIKGCLAQASLIIMTIVVGGAFHVLLKTGSVQALIAVIVKKFGGMESIFIPALMLVCALIATTQSVTIFIAFTPIIILMVRAMGFDSIVGAAIPLLGGAIGFSTGTLNVSSTILAQSIAELPAYSGIGYRFFSLFVFWFVTSIWLVRYARSVRQNPQFSPMYDLDLADTKSMENNELDNHVLDTRKILNLLALVVALSILVYGCINWKWGTNDISIVFLWLAIVSGLIGGFAPTDIALLFIAGGQKLLATALVIGLSRSISMVITAGKIIDPIVHGLVSVMTVMPASIRGMAMFWANILVNVPIVSASGQAGAVMPIFAPLADMVGITRQTAVLAYHFGDGFCNYILPWSSALMGNLAVANIPYDRWMRFMWKLFIVWVILGSVLVAVAQMMHYGPF